MSETPPHADAAHHAVEQAARTSYGRLVAWLAARWRDVAAAEDALSDAFAAALRTWPQTGVPAKPETWLLAAAHRRLIDTARHLRVRADNAAEITAILEAAPTPSSMPPFPDERLPLLFVCAHPAIAEETRAPLMLQTVLGLDAARIAAAWLVTPATMSQRLVRAKTKIRDARIRFQLPETHELPGRLEAVLEAIYAAYGTAWDDLAGADPRNHDLTREALWLARALHELLPGEPETSGLLALLLHCEARRPARSDAAGRYVPLSHQDTTRWNVALAAEAEQHLRTAFTAGRPGRFQLEAAIQSANAARSATGRTDWTSIVHLYEGLLRLAPTLGAQVGQAAALAAAQGPAVGLKALDALPIELVANYQPFWAARTHLLALLGDTAAAASTRKRALYLTADKSVRAFLETVGSDPTEGHSLPSPHC